jgi:uroporphyrinogen decarboxylase
MNSTEIIERVVRLEPTERMPVALLSAGAWAINSNGYMLDQALALDPEIMAGWLYEAYNQAGSDISWVGSGYYNLVVRAIGGKIKFRRKGTPDVSESLLKSADDVDGIDVDQVQQDGDIQTLYKVARLLVEKEKGQRMVGACMWGPFTLTGLLYGAEALMRDIYKNKAAVDKVMRFSVELYLKFIQGYLDSGVRVIFIAEPSASGDMISRKHFEDFALPYLKDIFHRLSGRNLIQGLHICGNIENRLDLIPESGAQILSLDYKVDLNRAKDVLGGKIAFSGNLNPVNIVQNATPEEVEAKTRECIGQVGTNGGYIVMPGCDIPPTTPLANLQAMSRTARAYYA